MNKRFSIQIKAAILLVIFGFNTVVGFACNMGFDMDFNVKHHSDEATIPVIHIHADGKEHIHYEIKKDTHTGGGKQEHKKHAKQDHDNVTHNDSDSNTKENSKENCCKDQVLKFEQIDKAVAKVFTYQIPIFAVCFFNDFYKDALYASNVAPKIYFVRSYHPPIADIRIAIRSFQI